MKVKEDYVSIEVFFYSSDDDSEDNSVLLENHPNFTSVSAAIEWWNSRPDAREYGDKLILWVYGPNRDKTFDDVSSVIFHVHTVPS